VCIDLQTSLVHCGACNQQCAFGGDQVGEVCIGGVCQCPADFPTTCGSGYCVNTFSDPFNCGGCGVRCDSGICSGGVCAVLCAEGSMDCGGFCADIANDPFNCGGCGIACPGTACVAGVCAEPEPVEEAPAPEAGAAFADDNDALAYALSLERLSLALFRRGLTDIPKARFDDMATGARTRLGAIRAHEKEHVALLEGLLAQRGGAPPEEPDYSFSFGTNPMRFLIAAQSVKETTVAAYAGLLGLLVEPALVAQLASLATVEGRHASFLAGLLGEEPFPSASDTAITRPDALQQIAPFLSN